MTYTRFPKMPLSIAISVALLFGCTTDNTAVTALEPQPLDKPADVKEQRSEVLLPHRQPIQKQTRQALESSPQRSEAERADALHLPQTKVAATSALYLPAPVPHYTPPISNDRFASFTDNQVKSVRTEPLSTFSIDVDTASYAIARQDLNNGRLPDPASARIEECLNYFDYSYAAPTDPKQPFSVTTNMAPSP